MSSWWSQCPWGKPRPYGRFVVTGSKTNMYYQRYAMHHGKASECLHCGLCEKNCPQRIAIREMLEEFAGLYEG